MALSKSDLTAIKDVVWESGITSGTLLSISTAIDTTMTTPSAQRPDRVRREAFVSQERHSSLVIVNTEYQDGGGKRLFGITVMDAASASRIEIDWSDLPLLKEAVDKAWAVYAANRIEGHDDNRD